MAIPKGKTLALVAAFLAIGLVAGTGAFTTVQAERTADVGVAGDSSAALAIEETAGPNAVYASQSAGTFQIDFAAGSNSGQAGVNIDAQTTIPHVFKITNQGSQKVAVTITKADIGNGDSTSEAGLVTFAVDGGNVSTVNSASNLGDDVSYASAGQFAIDSLDTDDLSSPGSSPNWDNGVNLETGETIYVGIYIDTTGNNNELTNNPNSEDLLDNINIYADAGETGNTKAARV